MEQNIILAGVGGQGILTIAKAISTAALRRNLNVKQAEVHGMSQRGGAVYSHLRISDQEISSEQIPLGKADLIIAVEPLEALRYAPMLSERGVIVTSTHATVNIEGYPPIEDLLRRLSQRPTHVALDMDRLARAAGSTLASNVVALGAAATFLTLSFRELEEALKSMFGAKGDRVVETNLRALRFGQRASDAYRIGLSKGLDPRSIRNWVETLPAEHLASDGEFAVEDDLPELRMGELTGAEAHALESILLSAFHEERRPLYEQEVYAIVEMIGAISPPRWTFVPKGSMIPPETLLSYPGSQVVLKLVSRDVSHKSDVGGVRFAEKSVDAVRSAMESMLAPRSEPVEVAGILVVEYIEHSKSGLGSELFVGVRATREFGPVIAAGLGGLETEYLASKLKPEFAVAKAVVLDSDAESFLDDFRKTAAYELLSGGVRGHQRLVSDAELLRCFRAFYSIAEKFCVSRGEEGPDIGELEVNPFAFVEGRLIPLDGRGQLRPAWDRAPAADRRRVKALLQPKTLAFAGVSAKSNNNGRIALANTLAAGFDPTRIRVVHPTAGQIDGVGCVPSIGELPFEVDALVASVPASTSAKVIEDAARSGLVQGIYLLSGGAGETEATEEIGRDLKAAIARGRGNGCTGPAVIGPNGMGARIPGARLDTFFIPPDKLSGISGSKVAPLALLSQSGAFVVSRLSALEGRTPSYSVSFGNQYDVTLSDLLAALLDRPNIEFAAIYLEGFQNLDGLECLRQIRKWREKGRQVIFYKAGRTEAGRSAAAGHTTALAGDYDVSLLALKRAGAWVVTNLAEFDAAIELNVALAGRKPLGKNTFAMTNAGMEAVAMGDALPMSSRIQLARLDAPSKARLQAILKDHKLFDLAAAQNPLDLTPMADEEAYAAVARWALDEDAIDAILVSCVPLTPALSTDGLKKKSGVTLLGSGSDRISASEKPIVLCIDAGPRYDAFAAQLRSMGFAVFRQVDLAMRTLAKWLGQTT